MKKLVSILMLVALLAALVAIPASSATTERVNAMLGALDVDHTTLSKYANSTKAYDGANVYISSEATSYVDFKFAGSKAAAIAEDCPKYNLNFEIDKEDSIYYVFVIYEFDAVYTIDTVTYYGQSFPSSANIDGFDILVSESLDPGATFTKVVSATELTCKHKWEVKTATVNDVEYQTVYYTETFAPIDCKYLVFGLTGVRCQHEEALAAIAPTLGLTAEEYKPNANPNYFRMTELEAFGVKQEAKSTEAATTPAETDPETTPADTEPETTPAIETTDKPADTTPEATNKVVTTKAPDDDKKGGCGSVAYAAVLFVVAVSAAGVVIFKKK